MTRRILRVGFFALALLGLSPHTPVFTDASQTVSVDAGEEFFIALASNETTGYTWKQAIDDGKILAYEGNVYQSPSSGLIGGGGQQIFIYHANRSGSTTIHFSYSRPFEPNVPPTKTTTFNVTVK
ncbi:MAG TPA: protease inhibitor I42 family protein [Candidatus Baltobacteraceae bacterium]|jgi:inhibitor of cysteine peptidase|nr:protease inhibitor I42 family protein [Candidatus Baltobacteraceae bacterium]